QHLDGDLVAVLVGGAVDGSHPAHVEEAVEGPFSRLLSDARARLFEVGRHGGSGRNLAGGPRELGAKVTGSDRMAKDRESGATAAVRADTLGETPRSTSCRSFRPLRPGPTSSSPWA